MYDVSIVCDDADINARITQRLDTGDPDAPRRIIELTGVTGEDVGRAFALKVTFSSGDERVAGSRTVYYHVHIYGAWEIGEEPGIEGLPERITLHAGETYGFTMPWTDGSGDRKMDWGVGYSTDDEALEVWRYWNFDEMCDWLYFRGETPGIYSVSLWVECSGYRSSNVIRVPVTVLAAGEEPETVDENWWYPSGRSIYRPVNDDVEGSDSFLVDIIDGIRYGANEGNAVLLTPDDFEITDLTVSLEGASIHTERFEQESGDLYLIVVEGVDHTADMIVTYTLRRTGEDLPDDYRDLHVVCCVTALHEDEIKIFDIGPIDHLSPVWLNAGEEVTVPYPDMYYDTADSRMRDVRWWEMWRKWTETTFEISEDRSEITISSDEPGLWPWDILPGGDGWFCGHTVLQHTDIIVLAPDQETVYVPEYTREIGEEAFAGTGIIQVFPEGPLETIGARAFADTDLRLIYLPVTVTSIAPDAFSGCENVGFLVRSDDCYAAEYAEAHGIRWCVVGRNMGRE